MRGYKFKLYNMEKREMSRSLDAVCEVYLCFLAFFLVRCLMLLVRR